ncbi:MAG: MoaD/ThiS family protein [Deltaproteobacteria bacterium]|nr:MAG: MoaD/ThiS family protein [Deltaproteobacteria bacterium]
MKIEVKILMVIKGEIVNKDLEEELEGGECIKDLLKKLNKSGVFPRGFLRSILKKSKFAVILHNGDRVDMTYIENRPLADGDKVAILSPMGGG